jgi:hypothetical protein
MVLTLAYPWQVGRSLGCAFSAQLHGIVRPAVATVALYAAALAVQPYVATDSWPLLIAGAVCTAGIFTVVASRAGLSANQRRRLLTRVRTVLGRARG